MAPSALPPGPKGWPILGVFPQFRKNPATYLLRMAHEFGDIVYLPLGNQQIYFLNHPDLVRDVLVTQQHKFKKSRMLERARILLGDGLLTSEGALHLRQRRLVQPAFYRERLPGYAATMVERAEAATGRWTQSGSELDLDKEMMRLTMDIVCRTLFSTEVDDEVDEIGKALTDVFGLFHFMLMPFSGAIEKLPFPAVRRFHRARKRLDETIYRLIAAHRANGKDTGDLLSMLLLAQDQEADGSATSMSDTQVRDEALTLFLAGHETTANALTWAWYLLSETPQAETRLHAEIDQVLGGRAPTLDDLRALPYTTGVFSEALRLYPPAWAIGRRALEDFQLDGYTVPRGAIIVTSPYTVHRDARWFSTPESFQPERWLTEDSARPKFAFFPFGGGARVCIGERFASMEGVLLLATIAQKWRFALKAGHPVDILARITLRPKHGMQMVAARRTFHASNR